MAMKLMHDHLHQPGRPLPDGFDPIVPVEEGVRLCIRSAYGTYNNTQGTWHYEVVEERLLWVDVGYSPSAHKSLEDAVRFAKRSAAQTRRNHRIRDARKRGASPE